MQALPPTQASQPEQKSSITGMLGEMAMDTAASFVPGLGPAMKVGKMFMGKLEQGETTQYPDELQKEA